MSKEKICKAIHNISEISGVPIKLLYAALAMALSGITASFCWIFVLFVVSTGSMLGLVKISNATQPIKQNSCQEDYNKAAWYLGKAEGIQNLTEKQINLLFAINYNLFYQNCRDLERQR